MELEYYKWKYQIISQLFIIQGTWKLQSINGNQTVSSQPAVTFQDQKVSYKYGNSYSGNYTINGNNVTFKPFIGTEMACPEQTPSQSDVQKALGSATSFTVDGNTLTLLGANNSQVARLTK